MSTFSRQELFKTIDAFRAAKAEPDLSPKDILALRLKYHRELIIPYYTTVFSDAYTFANMLKITHEVPFTQSLMFGFNLYDELAVSLAEIMLLDDKPLDEESYREVAYSLRPDYASLGKDLPSGPLLKYQAEAEMSEPEKRKV
jgi:hypothetical protein